jgi:Tol biopolymer transport system component
VDPVAWSPDGKSIFCQQNDSPHIYILSLKGGALKKYFTFPTPNVRDICMDPAHKIIVYSVFTTISDAWLVENFDPEVE